MKISKKKNTCFFLMSQGSFNPKIMFLGQKVCSVAVCTQELFLQPIIKDWSNRDILQFLTIQGALNPNFTFLGEEQLRLVA